MRAEEWEYGTLDWKERRWLWNFMRGASKAWKRGVQVEGGSADSGGVGMLPQARNFRNAITLDLKI
jgi:hypothetical protein